MNAALSRRQALLGGASALVVSFAMPALGQAAAAPAREEELDSWLAVAADGRVTAYCGKVELGTGIQTAFSQLVADELDVPLDRVTLLMGDTALCPDQGATTGSNSLYRGGPQMRQAAAEARATLLALTAERLKSPADRLSVMAGVVSTPDGRRVSYAELLGGQRFELKLQRKAKPKTAQQLTVIGQPVPRVELPAKVLGTHVYVHNLRLPDMLHGRVVRPPRPGAMAVSVDENSLSGLPGRPRALRKNGFVGVVADTEHDAIGAARALKVSWQAGPALPRMADMAAAVKAVPADDKPLVSTGDVAAALAGAAMTWQAEYFVPHQMHASIGPACAVADVRADGGTLWSPTQSSFATRGSIAGLLGLPPDKLRLIWIEGSGCYGQNGADDCTADAALLSQLAGRPVRVQWMRHDEHGNEPKGVAMVMAVQGGLDAQGRVQAWDYQVWSPPHSSRPGGDGGGNTLAGQQTGKPGRIAPVGADRNARCTYVFPNNRTTLHQSRGSAALRVSALRGLGSPQNTFANESFIDELAAKAGVDPIQFRIRHLQDERAIAVLQAVARQSLWDERSSPLAVRGASAGAGLLAGRGVGFVQYDNYSAYAAVVVRVVLDARSGQLSVRSVSVAHDCGLVVNPDGVRNQIEGNVLQAISRALLEEVAFDREGVTALDWNSYPILRFSDVPEAVDVTLLNRPELPMLGAGEATTSPVAAAIANALFDATGQRLRQLPLTPQRVLAALAR